MHFVHVALQVGKLEVHGADCIHDPMVEAVGIVANAFSAIAHPFEIIDALTDAALVAGRHDLLRGLAFLVELVHAAHQVLGNRRIGVDGLRCLADRALQMRKTCLDFTGL
ncbi:hypothetical protein Rmet_6754 (plasmid) [Cupriavidus metallidurans CH34]|uniref:Uncharacterized protein n=1 Tax=Cupriavidus metallidurans (strain ATCC 43123 / DSM 2839 / NBRC 102507 / CH34) TaxID=266264 RepID=D3DYG3_CUPMC|nr:hypothetical protein Rmet_6754 [Cupriavidus metallidurans CH34]